MSTIYSMLSYFRDEVRDSIRPYRKILDKYINHYLSFPKQRVKSIILSEKSFATIISEVHKEEISTYICHGHAGTILNLEILEKWQVWECYIREYANQGKHDAEPYYYYKRDAEPYYYYKRNNMKRDAEPYYYYKREANRQKRLIECETKEVRKEVKKSFATIISEVHKAEISTWIDHDCHGHAGTILAIKVKETDKILGVYNPLARVKNPEIIILDEVIKWGKAKNSTLPTNLDKWTSNNFLTLKETLKECLPHVRYFKTPYIENNPYEFKLSVLRSRDEFDAKTIYNICDKVANTVIILKVKDTGEILGGYNPLEWDNTNNQLKNSSCFSFDAALCLICNLKILKRCYCMASSSYLKSIRSDEFISNFEGSSSSLNIKKNGIDDDKVERIENHNLETEELLLEADNDLVATVTDGDDGDVNLLLFPDDFNSFVVVVVNDEEEIVEVDLDINKDLRNGSEFNSLQPFPNL
ncbi:hypothetical protein Glove_313g42 [Diversispora epigaea]|uniref:TLDc domain-containing protein n=1 Tax=Diversispora epigaea TaxID=1348612 RepID=A0A397HRY4_9GLOM|nr:hypothetical protein Glove_313g42 [Diversispora epigaea]